MNPFLILLALLLAAPALFNSDRPLQARENPTARDSSSPQAIVEAKLVAPLHQNEEKRPRFSRAPQPPSERRVRILDTTRHTDAQGHAFLFFAVDETHSFLGRDGKEVPEEAWRKEAITGCVYPESGKVIVKLGESYYPASVLWGSQAEAVAAGACRS